MVDPELVKVLTSFKDEIKNEMNSNIDYLKNEMNSFKDEIKNEMNSFKDELTSMNGRLTSLEGKVTALENKVTSVHNTCIVIEEEHGRKIDLLLDYASANIEKNEYYDKKFEKVDNKFFDHDARLAIIEGSDVYKTMIKGKGKTNLRNASLF